MVRIRLEADLGPGGVSARLGRSTFAPSAEVRRLIEEAWADGRRRLGEKLFDGPMCRLESFVFDGGHLHLELSRISYKPFLGTNLSHPELEEGSRANPVGLSCALVARDGPLVLGRRNSEVAYYPGRIHPFAGCLEPAEPVDVFAEARRELAEELSLAEGQLMEMRCMGMVEDERLRQPELIFLVRCALTAEQIRRQLDPGEHEAVFLVEPGAESARAALGERLLTPVAVATVRMWEKRGIDGE